MTIKINGTNTTAQPSITGADTDTGLVYGTDEVQVVTGGSTRATVDSSGNVGIGTSSPQSLLSVKVSAARQLDVIKDSGDDHLVLKSTAPNASYNLRSIELAGNDVSFSTGESSGTSYTERLKVNSNGTAYLLTTSTNGVLVASTTQGAATNKNLIVGGHSASTSNIESSTACFIVLSNGDIKNTNNSYGAISDVKLKENIVDASSQWDDIKGIQVRNYNLKESTGQQTHTQLGVVAQEVETVSPGLVSESPDLDADGNDLGTVTKSVNYSVLYMKAVKALQEAIAKIETLETQNASFEARLTTLEGGAE